MKKLYISIFALALVSTGGCKKFLEQPPDQRTEVNSVTKVAELLTSAYPEGNYIPFMEASSDNTEDKGFTYDDKDRFVTLPFSWRDNDSFDNDTPIAYWNESYKAIAAANVALEAIEKAEDKTAYMPYKGEALVARAYAHFMLVNIFSKVYDPATDNSSPGIPYVTQPEKVVSAQYTRGTVAAVYASIEKDLIEGLPLLKNSAYQVEKYHFNIAAAHAFAARFFLFKQEYTKVIEHVNAISSNSTFAAILRPWNSRYTTYTSVEMRTNFTQASEPSTLLLIETPSSWARTREPRFGFGQVLYQRMFTTPNVTGATWAHPAYYSAIPHWTFLKWNEYFVKASQNATIGDPYTIVPVLTADEAILNRAEAYAATGQNALALADLNTFSSTRIRNYNATTHAVTLAKIANYYLTADVKAGLTRTVLDFKKAEFLGEGLRWLDIIRHKLPVTHETYISLRTTSSETLGPEDPRRLFQLPSQVTLSGLALNPR